MKKLVLIVLCVIITTTLFSQNWEGGFILSGDYSKTFKSGLKFDIEEEIRWTGAPILFDRSKTSIGIDYKLFGKYLRIGGQFDYIFKKKWDNFENRYRVQCNLSFNKKIKRVQLQNRIAFLSDFFDETRGEYSQNPELYLREKVKLEYSIFHKPIQFGVSFEFFWRLNHPEFKIIDELRSELYANYRFNKRNELTIFVRMDNDIQVAEPENTLYLGFQYHFKN